MAHLVGQNAEERAREGAADFLRLGGAVELATVHVVRVGRAEDPVERFAKRDMRARPRAAVRRIRRHPGLRAGRARQGAIGEADHNRLRAVVLGRRRADVAVAGDPGLELEHQAAARNRVEQRDHRLDVGVEPDQIGERRSTPASVQVVERAVAEQTHLDRPRRVPLLSRAAG